jgi:hypothetical protein
MEIYKKCFENYEISNFGNCRRELKNGEYKIVKGSIQNRGYRYFQTKRNKKRQNYLFHHMVMECFKGERPEKLVIDHIDRNKLNNHIDNLRYVSQKENLKNTSKYRDDIKETDLKKRHKILNLEYETKIKLSKKFYCKCCEIACRKISELKKHNEGPRHKKKFNSIKVGPPNTN